MKDLHLPWMEASILIPLLGAIWVSLIKDPVRARSICSVLSGITCLFACAAWQDFEFLHVAQAEDAWHVLKRVFGRELLVIDHLSAPLLPLTALLYFLTAITTHKTKIRRYSFAWSLVSQGLALVLFTAKEPWLVIACLVLETIPLFLELRARKQNTRVFAIHMGLFAVSLVVGWGIVEFEGRASSHSVWAIVPLLIAVLVRSGVVPFHCWMLDLFDHASFGTALLFMARAAGAYAAIRLLLPVAPDWVLRSMGVAALVTAVYSAGMSLIQLEARRYFCYLSLSHSSLVMVGLDMVNPIALTGALCVWLSVGLSLGGFGLTLRALEARRGRVMLSDFQGLYEHMPVLAACFFLTGLGSVGFPGTIGFIGSEMLVDGAVSTMPIIAVAIVIAAALNGIAIVQAYFKIFTGTRHFSTVPLLTVVREHFAMLVLVSLILLGGIIPQAGVETRHRAADALLYQRAQALGEPYEDHHETAWFADPAASEEQTLQH